ADAAASMPGRPAVGPTTGAAGGRSAVAVIPSVFVLAMLRKRLGGVREGSIFLIADTPRWGGGPCSRVLARSPRRGSGNGSMLPLCRHRRARYGRRTVRAPRGRAVRRCCAWNGTPSAASRSDLAKLSGVSTTQVAHNLRPRLLLSLSLKG